VGTTTTLEWAVEAMVTLSCMLSAGNKQDPDSLLICIPVQMTTENYCLHHSLALEAVTVFFVLTLVFLNFFRDSS
jgi:hypothetical protein